MVLGRPSIKGSKASAFAYSNKYYDMIYAGKDYEAECNFLENIWQRYSKHKTKSVLDAGCGTGGHSFPLSKRGYNLTGVDSSKRMITIAKEKAEKNGVRIDFDVMDLCNLQINKKFDTGICMFNVIGYLSNNKNLLGALSNMASHLKSDSLITFDFWYGPAVLTTLPSSRMKTFTDRDVRVIRFVEPHLDILHHLCEVNYHIIVTKKNLIVEEGNERHVIRFYFPEEIKHLLDESGFQLIKLCPFLDMNSEPNERTWNVTAIARLKH